MPNTVGISRTILAICTIASIGLAKQASTFAEPISLAGQWRFSLDPNKEGVRQRYFSELKREH